MNGLSPKHVKQQGDWVKIFCEVAANQRKQKYSKTK